MGSTSLRAIFDEDPELYRRARPGYPGGLFDALREVGIGPGTRVLEIGPGTGQATAGLVALKARVVAVELGAGLAAVLRQQLPDVEVAVATFEDWPLPGEPFDAVAAFTAWHWLDPSVRTTKAAAALRPGGTLATVTTTHVAGVGDAFFARAQRCYETWDPATPPGLRLLAAESIPPAVDEVDSSPLFATVSRRRWTQDIDYSTRQYLDVLRTYSGHRALATDRRHNLLECIARLIDDSYGGAITKRYLL